MRDTAKAHQYKIARDTLNLSVVGANILGGMDKPTAWDFLLKHGTPGDRKRVKDDIRDCLETVEFMEGSLREKAERILSTLGENV
jgi:hypothetical protein